MSDDLIKRLLSERHMTQAQGLEALLNTGKEAVARIKELEAALRPFARAESMVSGFDGERIYAKLLYAKDASETINCVAVISARAALKGETE